MLVENVDLWRAIQKGTGTRIRCLISRSVYTARLISRDPVCHKKHPPRCPTNPRTSTTTTIIHARPCGAAPVHACLTNCPVQYYNTICLSSVALFFIFSFFSWRWSKSRPAFGICTSTTTNCRSSARPRPSTSL